MSWQDMYVSVDALQVARASAALLAAGAWDAAPTELNCEHASSVTLFLSYTRGAAGGAFDFQIQVSPYSADGLAAAGAAVWLMQSVYLSGGVVPGADTVSNVQREIVRYGSTAVGQEGFIYGPVELAVGAQRLRVRAREAGVVGTPGTLQIEVMFS